MDVRRFVEDVFNSTRNQNVHMAFPVMQPHQQTQMLKALHELQLLGTAKIYCVQMIFDMGISLQSVMSAKELQHIYGEYFANYLEKIVWIISSIIADRCEDDQISNVLFGLDTFVEGVCAQYKAHDENQSQARVTTT